jgi:hypothetical protein
MEQNGSSDPVPACRGARLQHGQRIFSAPRSGRHEQARLLLDLGLEPRGRSVLGVTRQIHRPAQSDLVGPRRASRLLDLADLEHRSDQVAAARLSLHHRSAVPIGGIARPDWGADAVPVHICGARFGGRNWTIASAALLSIPTTALAHFVTRPDTPFWLMLMAAATAGFGGGNFSILTA